MRGISASLKPGFLGYDMQSLSSSSSASSKPTSLRTLLRSRPVSLLLFVALISGLVFVTSSLFSRLTSSSSSSVERGVRLPQSQQKLVNYHLTDIHVLASGKREFHGIQDTSAWPHTNTANIKIPKLVHMSVKSAGHLSAKQQDVINAWKKLHPDFKIVLHEDPDMLDLVTEHYPQFLNLYLNTVDSVERVDIWRYLIMHHQGGVYADSDWKPVVPVYEWHTNINPNGTTAPDVLLGYEEAYSFFGDLQIIQWGFYSVPGHPLFLDTVNHIHHMYIDELLTSHYRGDAVQRTGPEPFTWSVLRYLQQRGDVVLADLSRTHSLRLDDFLIGSVDKFDGKPGILAEHLFSGTWKSDSWDDESKPRDWQLKSRRGFEKKVIEFWNAKMGPL